MDIKKIVNTDQNINDKYIDNPIFSLTPPDFINLNDPVITYNDGRDYKIISLEFAKRYPVIYDKYYDKYKKNKGFISDITVVFCPFTFSTMILFSKYIPTNKIYNSSIVLADGKDKDKIIVPLIGKLFSIRDNKIIDDLPRKNEVRIMILRNAISKYPDCLYLHYGDLARPLTGKKYYQNNKILFPTFYTSSKYHPKTLVYGIKYKSKDLGKEKYTVIVSNDATKNKINSYNIQNNGIEKYFSNTIEKIREKGGIVIPCYWFAWYAFYPNSKVIKL